MDTKAIPQKEEMTLMEMPTGHILYKFHSDDRADHNQLKYKERVKGLSYQ
ncbi:MAG: hypothetical protein HGB11_01720 [Chlorobiales bacterium]|nr:hypothetical protein [Chlorobiales bacterium]